MSLAATERRWTFEARHMNQKIVSFLQMALECSILVDPLDPGLTYQELVEIGKRVGYLDGEINDALPFVTRADFGVEKLLPSPQQRASWAFVFSEDPEYRNISAFDFVVAELNSLTRSEGAARALIQRSVIVERAIANGIPRNDIEVAITWQVLSNQLVERDGIIRFKNGGVHGLPSARLKGHPPILDRKPDRARAYPIVKDVVARRTDDRSKHIEPLDALGTRARRPRG